MTPAPLSPALQEISDRVHELSRNGEWLVSAHPLEHWEEMTGSFQPTAALNEIAREQLSNGTASLFAYRGLALDSAYLSDGAQMLAVDVLQMPSDAMRQHYNTPLEDALGLVVQRNDSAPYPVDVRMNGRKLSLWTPQDSVLGLQDARFYRLPR